MQEQRYRLTSASPMFFGAPVMEKKRSDETHEQFEERTWRQKVHQSADGQAYIQPFALKNAIESAGKRLNMKLTGKATYTKLLRQGIMVVQPLLLTDPATGKPIKCITDGETETVARITPRPLFVPSDGVKGSGKRVMRIFPEVQAWQTEATVIVVDPRLTVEIMLAHIEECGKFIGFGSMRVENGGITGRFSVEAIS
jgi:hypothetical protein